MKKMRIFCLLLCFVLLLQGTCLPVRATEPSQEGSVTAWPESDEQPPEVAYGGVPISNGCRSINGMIPLGGTDKILKSAQAAFIYELNTETIIYSYNPDVRLYPGSLAKIMTALIAIEECDMDQEITFSTKWNDTLPAKSIVAKLMWILADKKQSWNQIRDRFYQPVAKDTLLSR